MTDLVYIIEELKDEKRKTNMEILNEVDRGNIADKIKYNAGLAFAINILEKNLEKE